MSSIATEEVLVLPTDEFRRLGYFEGFTSDVARYFPAVVECDQLSYQPREAMEEDPSHKQLIPYVIFRYRSPAGQIELFQYRRGGGQGEARLHAKRSVGVGGHISSLDADQSATATGADVYEEGLRRELAEEVDVRTSFEASCVGLINDDQTPVGRVHLGVVHIYDVAEPNVVPQEPDILDAGFRPIDELRADLEQFESWSQIVLQALFT